MGVYVFRCLHGPYVKVGHHLVTRTRPNAYYRVAGRGFGECVHPEELDGLLYMSHLSLLAWYPTLTRHEEILIHRQFREGSVGEFHHIDDASEILHTLDSLGKKCTISEAGRMRAVRWGRRQVRRAQRRRKVRGKGA